MKKCVLLLVALCGIGFFAHSENQGNRSRSLSDPILKWQIFKQMTNSDAQLRVTNPSVKGYVSNPYFPQMLDSIATAEASENTDYVEKYTYNAKGNIVEIVKDGYSGYKREYAYDDNNRLIRIITYYSSADTWIADDKWELEYNSEGYWAWEYSYDWNTATNQWENWTKFEYTYDYDKNMFVSIEYAWNNNQWEAYDVKTEITYNENGYYLTSKSYEWDTQTNTWVPIENRGNSVTYDDKGNILTTSRYETQIEGYPVEIKHKYEYQYNEYGNPITEKDYYWNRFENRWELSNTKTYYYSDKLLSNITETYQNSSLQVYVNQAVETIAFYLSENTADSTMGICIYDIKGKVCLTTNVVSGQEISVQSLPAGIYLAKIQTADGSVVTEKFVKK